MEAPPGTTELGIDIIKVDRIRDALERHGDRFPRRILNIHPALLPAFPGRTPVEDVLAAGAAETGVTVHWVDEGVDSGPIIAQERVTITSGDTAVSLRERLRVIEHRLYPAVLRELSK